MEEQVDETFFLAQQCEGHQRGIRSCCLLEQSGKVVTASYDGYVFVWKIMTSSSRSTSSSSSSLYQFDVEERHHLCQGPIYCVIDGTLARKPEYGETFFVGTQQENQILWANTSGTVLYSFQGHSGPVSSLTIVNLPDESCVGEDGRPVLVSGSWDSTARLWDLNTCSVLYSLAGHSYAVTVYGWRPPNSQFHEIVTGSQDKRLKFWSFENQFASPVAEIPDAHCDIIRGFAQLSETLVVTCSNDGYLNVWNFLRRECVTRHKAHNAFVFDVTTLQGWKQDEDVPRVVSASEDRTVRIWSTATEPWTLEQTILHPATVWNVTRLQNGDFVSACDDAQLRRWTPDISRALPKEERDIQKTIAKSSERPSSQSSIDVRKLPDVHSIATVRGSHPGQYRLFRDGDEAVAYAWNDDRWERIGNMLGPADSSIAAGDYYDGDNVFPSGFYDYVFRVQVGEQPELKPLPYKRDQNTLLVAENFCAREALSKTYIPEIENFIKQNSGNVPKTPASLPETSVVSRSTSTRHCPLQDYVSFTSMNIVALRDKIKSYNEEQKLAGRGLSALEEKYLDALLEKMASPRFLASELRQCELDVVFHSHLARWPSSMLVPVIDLWRIVNLHPQSSDIYKKCDGGWQFIHTALQLAATSATESTPLMICCYRYLANLYLQPTNRSSATRYTLEILRRLREPPVAKGSAVAAWVAVLSNVVLAFYQLHDGAFAFIAGASTVTHTVETVVSTVSDAVASLLRTGPVEPTLLYRLSMTVGTLLLQLRKQTKPTENVSLTASLNNAYQALETAIRATKEEELIECLEELRSLRVS